MNTGLAKRPRFSNVLLLSAALAASMLVVWSQLGQTSVSADDVTRMSIDVSGPDAVCIGEECWVEPGATFTVTVNADAVPDGGYLLVQGYIDYGLSLTYLPTENTADEVLWPDCETAVAVRDTDPGIVLHGCLTGLIPPLPLSTYAGPVFQLEFGCTEDVSNSNVQLLPFGDELAGNSGALYAIEKYGGVTPKVNSVTVHCAVEPPTPTATPPVPTPPAADLPQTGTGAMDDNGSANPGLWLIIAALVFIGTAGLGASRWRAARSHKSS